MTVDKEASLHIQGIYIGVLLPVYFDRHKILVEDASNFRVFKAFPLHDMAPVTARIPDANKEREVAPNCLLHRLFAPGKPMNRIVSVLS
jgi:hypothetical protein